MRWYTAIGMKKDDADGRFCVWVDGEEKVLTEMETILWAALTWSFCEEDKVHSQMHRLLVFSLGEKQEDVPERKLYTVLSAGQSWLPWPFHGQNA